MENVALKLNDAKIMLKVDVASQGILVLTDNTENMKKKIYEQNNDAEIVSFNDDDLFVKLYSERKKPLFIVSTVDEYKKWQALRFPVIISDVENVENVLETSWNAEYEFDGFKVKVKFNTDFDRKYNEALILV